MRTRLVVLAALVIVASCSSQLSLPDYAKKVESLVTTMNARIDAGEVAVDADPTLANIRSYMHDRVAARDEFIAAFSALDPPDEAADLHTTALDIITRLTAAERELAAVAERSNDLHGLGDLFATPEGLAARAVDEEAITMCMAAQAELDKTQQAEQFAGTPWIPPEMKQVIRVAFRCDRAER